MIQGRRTYKMVLQPAQRNHICNIMGLRYPRSRNQLYDFLKCKGDFHGQTNIPETPERDKMEPSSICHCLTLSLAHIFSTIAYKHLKMIIW